MLISSHDLAGNLIGYGFVLGLLVIWSIVWKALALWKSARAGSKVWFVVFLFVNTLGILEMIYLFALSKPTVSVSPEVKV